MHAWRFAAAGSLGLIAVVQAGAFTAIRRTGLSARPEPSAVEAAVARRIRSIAISAAERERRNPFPETAAGLARAREHFADHCASCHGRDGGGKTEIGSRMYPRTPDMRPAETQQLTDGEIFHIIQEGVRFTGMPGWAGEHTDEESWQLVRLIRHLPNLTPEEVRGAASGAEPKAAPDKPGSSESPEPSRREPHRHEHGANADHDHRH